MTCQNAVFCVTTVIRHVTICKSLVNKKGQQWYRILEHYYLIHHLTNEVTISFLLAFLRSVIPNAHERFLPFSSIALVLYTYRNSLMSMASLWNYRMHLKAWNLDFIRILYIIFAWCDQLKIIIFFTATGEDDSSLYCSQQNCLLNSAFVSRRRWVRLLFGREFPLQDLLVVWDALFADGLTLTLVDYVFVAMLLYIRDACKC